MRYAQTTGLRVERQIVFDTIGPAMLKERELALKAQQGKAAERSGALVQTLATPEPATMPVSAGASPQPGETSTARHNTQAGTSEIEPASKDSVDTPTTSHRFIRQSTSLGALFKQSPRPNVGSDSEPAGSTQRGRVNVNTEAEKRAHLEGIKRQLDTRAGIDPIGKKGRSLFRLIGLGSNKPKSDARQNAAQQSRGNGPRTDSGRQDNVRGQTKTRSHGGTERGSLLDGSRSKPDSRGR